MSSRTDLRTARPKARGRGDLGDGGHGAAERVPRDGGALPGNVLGALGLRWRAVVEDRFVGASRTLAPARGCLRPLPPASHSAAPCPPAESVAGPACRCAKLSRTACMRDASRDMRILATSQRCSSLGFEPAPGSSHDQRLPPPAPLRARRPPRPGSPAVPAHRTGQARTRRARRDEDPGERLEAQGDEPRADEGGRARARGRGRAVVCRGRRYRSPRGRSAS